MPEQQKPAAAPPAVPEYLRKYMATVETPQQDADSMASASMQIPRVSLKAKKFRFIENGEEIFAEAETHVVILAAEPPPGKFVKTYYEGAYNPGDTSPPTCASSDGIRPDSWVTQPQNELCGNCRWNQFGSATSTRGKPAKKCRDSKRLWVARPDDIDGTVYGLGVPVTSLKNLSEFGQKIKDTGMPVAAAVAKLGMIEDESFPIITFDLVGWLNEESFTRSLARNETKNWTGALKAPNPPVEAAKLGHVSPATQGPADGQPAPGANKGDPAKAGNGSVEGEFVPSKKTNSADEALKNWGSGD